MKTTSERIEMWRLTSKRLAAARARYDAVVEGTLSLGGDDAIARAKKELTICRAEERRAYAAL